ncbi:MAG: cation transporter [bacterium]|nr:MAG: cation transporter [bacterium]
MTAKEHHHNHDLAAGRKVTLAGMGINAALIALKIIGGIYGRSKALLADAIHSTSDFLSDVLVLVGLHFFHKEEDRDHPYGHGKIETLATIGVGILLLLAAIRIGVDAALNIHRGEIVAPRRYAIVIAVIAIVTKEILYRLTVRIGKRLKSEIVIANAWHHRSDAWSSVVTLVGVTCAAYVPSLRVLDSYAALLVSFFIVKVSLEILLSAIKKIIDTSPSAEFLGRVRTIIRQVPGVKECHDLTGRYYADKIRMEIHIEVDPELTVRQAHEIADSAVTRVKEEFEEISSVLVHIDPFSDTDNGEVRS